MFFPPAKDANRNAQGLSRKTIDPEPTNSLNGLDMETHDLYQIHRWDYETPIEVSLRGLDSAVRQGRVRYLGASSMWAYQFSEALHASDRHGLERFATMQNLYNLVYREEEREMLPLCAREDIGVIPWSPLEAGYLAGPHREIDATTRGEYLPQWHERGNGAEINERVEKLAAREGVSMAKIALAWLLGKDRVDAPIVGVSSVEHLEDAVEALKIDLGESDVAYL